MAKQLNHVQLINDALALMPAMAEAAKRRWQEGRPLTRERVDRIMDAIERRCQRRCMKSLEG